MPDIPETNNVAERALRHPVQWRKTSHCTQSEHGSRFVESILTVLATCQQHQQNAFAYLYRVLSGLFQERASPAVDPSIGRSRTLPAVRPMNAHQCSLFSVSPAWRSLDVQFRISLLFEREGAYLAPLVDTTLVGSQR